MGRKKQKSKLLSNFWTEIEVTHLPEKMQNQQNPKPQRMKSL